MLDVGWGYGQEVGVVFGLGGWMGLWLGCQMLDVRCWMLDVGWGYGQDVGRWMLDVRKK